MKQVFVINDFGKLNNIAYCSRRIKEHLDANCVPHKSITAMVTHAPKYLSAQHTLKNIFGIPQVLFYSENQAFYVYHDIHHTQSSTIVLMLDESTTTEVIKALTHNPDFEVKAKSIQLFTLRHPYECEYAGEL